MKGVRATSWVSILAPGDGDPRHGRNGYSNLGCRCQVCRDANTAYNLAMRAVRTERLKADPSLRPHGKYTTYAAWGCRCAPCKASSAAQSRRHAKRGAA